MKAELWLQSVWDHKVIKDLIALANSLDLKGLKAEADSLDKIIRASLEDAPSYWHDKDLPSVEKHKENQFYYIKANRAIGKGDGAVFFGLQDSVYHTLKSLGKLSKESESPQGPFTAEDVRVIASIISDYLKKDFRSVVFPELGEDVKKMIGKEVMSLTQEDWPLASTVIGFEIIKYNPILSFFGKAGEGEKVGEISIDGQITLSDPDSFGKPFYEYVPVHNQAVEDYYREVRSLDPRNNKLHRGMIGQINKVWLKKIEEAKRRAIERDSTPENYPEEGPVSDLEIPMGKEIELIENPEHYNFPGDSSMINIIKDDLEHGRSFRTKEEFPYEDSKERELMENYINLYSSTNLTKDLVKLANNLDSKGLRAEADALDSLIQKLAGRQDGREFDNRRRLRVDDYDYDIRGLHSCKSCLGDGVITVERECSVCNGTGEEGKAQEFLMPPERPRWVPDDRLGRGVQRQPKGHENLKERRRARDLKESPFG